MEMKRSKYKWMKEVQAIVDIFENYFEVKTLRPRFVSGAIMKFSKSLSYEVVADAMSQACIKLTIEKLDITDRDAVSDRAEQCVKYFCGICWRAIKEKEEQTIFIDELDKEDIKSE
jgi:hypothetical protein